jgi:hypothetical protein
VAGEEEENSPAELYKEHARATFNNIYVERMEATVFVCIDYEQLSWARDGNSMKFIMVDLEGSKACWTVWADDDGKRKALSAASIKVTRYEYIICTHIKRTCALRNSKVEEAIKPLPNTNRTWGLFAVKVSRATGQIITPSPTANPSYSLGAKYVFNPTRVPANQVYVPMRIDLRDDYCKYFISRAGDPSRWHERSEDYMPRTAASPKGVSMALFRSPAKPTAK